MKDLPSYPEWAPINANVRSAVQAATAQYPPFSDFNHTNLHVWDVGGAGGVTNIFGNLAFRLQDYITHELVYSFIGHHRPGEAAKLLLDDAAKQGARKRLQLVPEFTALALADLPDYNVKEDLDGNDYVLSLSSVANPVGGAFAHLRRAFSNFEVAHGHHAVFEELDIDRPDIQTEILEVFMSREVTKADNNHWQEFHAMRRLFESGRHKALFAYGLRIKNKLVAFIIGEVIDKLWCLGHFWKANTIFKGAYSYLMRKTAESLLTRGFRYMNIEQDLGIEGLRRAKLFLRPARFLKKYTVYPKDNDAIKEGVVT